MKKATQVRRRIKRKQINHSTGRLMERYGIEYTAKLRRDFVHRISKCDGACFLTKLTRKRYLFGVPYNGIVLPVVFDMKTRNVITFLNQNALLPYQEKVDKLLYMKNSEQGITDES
jgi:hypothetical protein